MTAIFFTHQVSKVTNGPTKFAQYLLRHAAGWAKLELTFVSESEAGAADPSIVRPIKVSYPKSFEALGSLFRMYAYWKYVKRSAAHSDVIVFNHALDGVLTALSARKPAVVGMLNDFKYLDAGLTSFRLHRKWLAYFFYRQLEKLFVRRAAAVIVCSHALQARAEKEYACRGKVKVLYQGVDLSFWAYQKHEPINCAEHIKVLFVKSNPIVGGLSSLFEAIKQLPGFYFEVTLAGAQQERFGKIIAQHGKAPNLAVQYLGSQTQQQIRQLMYTNDVLCIPSASEGLGVALIEGLATGIPVVSTDTGGVPEVLNNGKCGWLAPADNPLLLAQTLKACILNKEEACLRSKAGREHVEAHFSAENMAIQFEALLNETVL